MTHDTALTQERLRELLHYNPTTGFFTWRIPGRNFGVGRLAGYTAESGYVMIGVDSREYRAHRLAFLYVSGCFPEGDTDHINGRRTDNRWSNLRTVSRSVNLQNQRAPHGDSASGYLGVSPAGKRWRAYIRAAGKQIHIGRFDTPEEAYQAYLKEKRKLHEGCTI